MSQPQENFEEYEKLALQAGLKILKPSKALDILATLTETIDISVDCTKEEAQQLTDLLKAETDIHVEFNGDTVSLNYTDDRFQFVYYFRLQQLARKYLQYNKLTDKYEAPVPTPTPAKKGIINFRSGFDFFVDGETYEAREIIKKYGFRWDKFGKQWYAHHQHFGEVPALYHELVEAGYTVNLSKVSEGWQQKLTATTNEEALAQAKETKAKNETQREEAFHQRRRGFR